MEERDDRRSVYEPPTRRRTVQQFRRRYVALMIRRKWRKASIRWSDGEKCVKLTEERSETVFLVVGVKLTVPFLIGFNEFVGSSHAMTRKHGKTFYTFLVDSYTRTCRFVFKKRVDSTSGTTPVTLRILRTRSRANRTHHCVRATGASAEEEK